MLFINKKNKKQGRSANEKIDNLFDMLDEYIILVQVGEDLVKYGTLIADITQELREEIKDECGFIFPEVHIKDNSFLQENEFRIYIRRKLEGSGFLVPNEYGIREEFYDSFKTVLYANIDKIFSNEIVERYIDAAQKRNGWLVWNITSIISVPDIRIILSDIISYGKSINNIGYVFEKIGEQILLNGGYQTGLRVRNPHDIAKEVAGKL